jgi:hypothetical protein
MPTIFAIDGAEDSFYGFGELGAYSSSVASLQTALIALGQKVGDATLMALVLDGLIGPKTTAAANRAFAIYVTGAPANFATGTLTQSQVSTNASSLASYVNAELSRRGAAKTTALVPAAAAPTAVTRAAAPAVSDSSAQIVKYAAIGLGGVVVASVLYMLWRSRQGRPAFGSAQSELLAQIEDTKQDLRDCQRQHASVKPGSINARNLASRCRKLTIALDWLKREARGSQKWRGGLGALSRNDADTLERMMDREGGVSDVFDTIGEIASEKADHVRENWQDERLARKWSGLARKMGALAATTQGFEVK